MPWDGKEASVTQREKKSENTRIAALYSFPTIDAHGLEVTISWATILPSARAAGILGPHLPSSTTLL